MQETENKNQANVIFEFSIACDLRRILKPSLPVPPVDLIYSMNASSRFISHKCLNLARRMTVDNLRQY